MNETSLTLKRPDRDFLLQHPAHFIALGFGVGLAPTAPGTWGTLVALPLYVTSYQLGGAKGVIAAALVMFALGIWAAGVTGRALGAADHGGIVVDEIAAFLLVLAATPPTLLWIATAFLLFRFFDIFKPWPIAWADRHVKGGFGVMLDDLLAAGYVVLCLQFIAFLFLALERPNP